MRKHITLILPLFVLFTFQISHSQITVLSGTINKYTRVKTVDTCSAQITVDNASLYTVGSKVLLIQMNGAVIKSSNNSSFGEVENQNNVGKYEINQIDSINGNTVFLKFRFLNEYFPNPGVVQMVSFPQYDIAVVNDTLRPKPWDGETGGIIAFEANSVTLNAPIVASSVGFRGGAVKAYNNCEAAEIHDNYFYALNTTGNNNGGPKGEGIALPLPDKETGKGPQANGGGGGNNHKSGGGGGANIASGGQGGEQERANIFRCQGKNPGLGGLGLSANGINHLFFGGGGGAGQNKEGSDSKGGNGGGIVIIKANTFEGNNKSILANGGSAALSAGDGGGGGGAGGNIVLQVNRFTGNLTLESKGGNGGNSVNGTGYKFGSGGGGAGGRVFLLSAAPTVTSTVTGGIQGKNVDSNTSLNAQKGGDGSVSTTTFALPFANDTIYRRIVFTTQPNPILICEGNSTTLNVKVTGPAILYQWQINTGTGYKDLTNDNDYSGVQTPTLVIKNVTAALNPYLYRCSIKSNCLNTAISNSNGVSLKIKNVPVPIFTYSVNNNTVSFIDGSSNALTYKWSFGDGSSDTIKSPVHTYALQDTYRVVLRVINECGTREYTTLLNLNTPPFAGFTANSRDACAPSTLEFSNTSSDNVRKYFWTFDGGIPATSTVKNPSVTYNNPGQYNVRLIVENGHGRDTFIRNQYIKVTSKPAVNFSATKNGLVVNFINNTTNATSFTWEFGNGDTSNQISPSYSYQLPGTYIVKLTARNSCGSLSDTLRISIFSLPTATVSASQISGCAPMIVQFSGRNVVNVASWNWSFPGGVPTTSNLPNPRVTYTRPGKYDVSLSITNAVGTSHIKQDTFIRVSESPMAAFN
jgi:PKD repeat protein